MQKVEIILLPFATKYLPRHINLSKFTLLSALLSLIVLFVFSAYLILDKVTNVVHEWQLSSLNQSHQILLTTLGKMKSKALEIDRDLSEKDKSLEYISLITETSTVKHGTPAVLNQYFSPWDERGRNADDYYLTQLFSLKGVENTVINKLSIVNEALNRIENHIDAHLLWANLCKKDMQQKYNRWAHIPSVFPVEGFITCGFGARRSPFGGPRVEQHMGLDIAGPIGIPLKASADGKILYAGWVSGYGNLIILDHENGMYSYYGHCSLINVVEGQKVNRYQSIGLLGTSGRSTGPHVHFEVREGNLAKDPLDFIDEN